MTYKIYKIIADAPDGRFYCYIGSTRKTLDERLKGHLYKFQHPTLLQMHGYTRSYLILDKPWYDMVLIEDLGNVSKREAFRKEGEIIKQYANDNDYIVVNRNVSGRTDVERYQDNKEYKKAQSKAYRESHVEYCANYRAEYYAKNKLKIMDQQKEYKKTHPRKWNPEKAVCECGSVYSKGHASHHRKTIKHQNFINSK